jgi:acetyltransferase
VARAIVSAAQGATKPVLACIMGDESVGEARLILQGNGIPMYVYPETMGKVLSAMLYYKSWRNSDTNVADALSGLDKMHAASLLAAAGAQKVLGEAATRPLLEAYGIPVIRGAEAKTAVEAAAAAVKIGFPVVMKIVSQEILHKSDVGGIRLNLGSESEVSAEFDKLMAEIKLRCPKAVIEGVLIEQMAPKGQEVIVGMKRDPGFGPLLMFGLGGIYVELFKDVAFRVAPVSRVEALAMIHETAAGRLLTGFRGQPKADLDAVVDAICRIGQLALDFPEIQEMEINPLLVFPEGEGSLALDGRVLL